MSRFSTILAILMIAGCGDVVNNFYYPIPKDSVISDAGPTEDATVSDSGLDQTEDVRQDAWVSDTSPDSILPIKTGGIDVRVLVGYSLVADATVSASSDKYGTLPDQVTDGQKLIQFKNVPIGQWKVTAKLTGHSTEVSYVVVIPNYTEDIKLVLQLLPDSGIPPDFGQDAGVDGTQAPDMGVDSAPPDAGPDSTTSDSTLDGPPDDLDPSQHGTIEVVLKNSDGKPVSDGNCELTHLPSGTIEKGITETDDFTVMPTGDYKLACTVSTVVAPRLPYTQVLITPQDTLTLSGQGKITFTVTYTLSSLRATAEINVVNENGSQVSDGQWSLDNGIDPPIKGKGSKPNLQVLPGTYTFSALIPAGTDYQSLTVNAQATQSMASGTTSQFEVEYKRKDVSLLDMQVLDDAGLEVYRGDCMLRRISTPAEDMIHFTSSQAFWVKPGTYQLVCNIPTETSPFLSFSGQQINPTTLTVGANSKYLIEARYTRPAGSMTVQFLTYDGDGSLITDARWYLWNGTTLVHTGNAWDTVTLPSAFYTATAVVPPGNTKYLPPTVNCQSFAAEKRLTCVVSYAFKP